MIDTYSNPHSYDRWTTPCCNVDIQGGDEGIRQCPECNGPVLCTSEEIPQAVCTTKPEAIERYREFEGEA